MSLLYTYYGDDFTGSTDVLEQLASNGISTVLYLTPPSPVHLAAFPDVRAIGIAGDSRSRSPQWMSANLPKIFSLLKTFNAPIAHYKVCSTFDSSPTHGNIGRAIELGIEAFNPLFVPIVVGAPHLRRYVAFGNLFVSTPGGAVQRIDRHPMSRHPITPMAEADLRLHLKAQTATPIGLLDMTVLYSGTAEEALASQLAAGNKAILFDTIDNEMQTAVGNLLWFKAQRQPIFSASSSGLTAAIVPALRKVGLAGNSRTISKIEASTPLLVVSGSCSPVTERQIRYALANDYCCIALDPSDLMESNTAVAVESAISSIADGRDTVLYTSLGSPTVPIQGEAVGSILGELLKEIIARTSVRRVLLCGGDTSSHAVQQLAIYALTWVASIEPGAPLCRAHADDPTSPLNNLELVLKGGQIGAENFFDAVRGK